ncbi:MAG TPA: PQQ-binding-like beta-propeller repeat protein [Verrucomicrobiae bacterium]|jgi:outer membrane protein assembly factor BamB|nr:PQQ-binding-like beta-propeller repeat protein [Verrucomicrobiae bacterium]
MVPSKLIYLGVKGVVMAINPATGQSVWETALKGAEFVNVILDGENLFATTRGEIFCLDPLGGGIRWHNPLKGYGLGLITIAGDGIAPNASVITAEKRRRDQQQAAAASSASAAST